MSAAGGHTSHYYPLIAQGAEPQLRGDQLAEAYAAGQISISQLATATATATATARIREDREVVERRISAAQPVPAAPGP